MPNRKHSLLFFLFFLHLLIHSSHSCWRSVTEPAPSLHLNHRSSERLGGVSLGHWEFRPALEMRRAQFRRLCSCLTHPCPICKTTTISAEPSSEGKWHCKFQVNTAGRECRRGHTSPTWTARVQLLPRQTVKVDSSSQLLVKIHRNKVQCLNGYFPRVSLI